MINEYENLLRNIIIEILGSDSSKYKISQDRIDKWNEKMEIEIKKFKGAFLEKRIIYYSDFFDLKTIIFKHWEAFLPILLNKKRFEVFFDEIEKLRNNVAHGRELTKSQNLLLEGILLDQKNLKTIYHNKNEMKEDYFIRINRVSDNFGNVFENTLNTNNKILRVGDNYELIVEAVDPKDREIEYEIKTLLGKFSMKQKQNRFNFIVPESLISRSISLLIFARTPLSEYKNQVHCSIMITVLPE